MRHNPKHERTIISVHPRPINLRSKIESANLCHVFFCDLSYVRLCAEERRIIIELKKPVVMLRQAAMPLEVLEPEFVKLIEKDFIFQKDISEVIPLMGYWIHKKYGVEALKSMMCTDAFVNRAYNSKSIFKYRK